MGLGDRIRAAREKMGLTQSELAEAIGVQSTAVTLWENKKNPRGITAPHLHKVAEVLGVTAASLLGEAEERRSTFRPRMTSLVVSEPEKALLELFRTFPEKLQLLQLAHFVECAKLGESDHLPGQMPCDDLAAVDAANSHTA